MIDSGVYQLLVYLDRNSQIEIGKLGTINFHKGFYIYTGSAKKNMFHRLRRHFSQDKKLRWHIDYLLQSGEIVAFYMEKYRTDLECKLNRDSIKRYINSVLIPKFGSSDCKCKSHLIYIPT